MGIPDNIKKYRLAKKLTQKQLAELINKKEITVRRYEKGDIQPPLSVLLDIAIALDQTLESIIDDDDKITYNELPGGYIVKVNKNNKDKEFEEVYKKVGAKIEGNKITLPPISFDEMKEKVNCMFPALEAEIKFLSDPNIEKTFNYSFDKLAIQGGYQELLILAIEKAIKDTLDDIKNHIEAGDLFDGVSSWITKESPLYEILKAKREENK